MELYEVESTRWYYSSVFYRVVANSHNDAWQRAERMDKGVVEVSATDPEWNGEEEYLHAEILETVHDIFPSDEAGVDHINCQYIGNNLWNCGHSDLPDLGENEWIQLPLWKEDKNGTSV